MPEAREAVPAGAGSPLKFRTGPAEGTGMRRRLRRTVIASALIAGTLTVFSAQPAFAFTDVPASYWDQNAIQWVAATNTWMQDYGTQLFKPTIREARKYLARTLVTIYAPNEPPDPKMKIKDLPSSDPFWPYANVAIKLGWMPRYKSGAFAPDGAIRVAGFDKAVVLALGLSDSVRGLQRIHMVNGTRYTVPPNFPYLQLGRILQIHPNHSTESMDIESTDLITRDEVAYSVWWATHRMSWQLTHAQQDYTDVELPNLDPSVPILALKQQLTAYAFREVGYPYIWAGEWNKASPPGYCCGSQPKGGFDCSGFTWWVMKRYESGYNAAQFRPYAGWSLPQRTSYTMAEYTTHPVPFNQLRVGDLMFFASNGGSRWQDVDHVALYLGNGWEIGSTGSNDGVTLDRTDQGTWYYDTFVYGRRLFGTQPKSSLRSLQPYTVTEASLLGGDRE
jgi:hypothetical protein